MGDYVTVDGYKIYYEKKGNRGETIILNHGIPSSSFLWRKVQERLAQDFVVYAYDMLGYGKSDKPAEADFTWTGQAKRLGKFMDVLGIKKANIVGHDQGGVSPLYSARCIQKSYPAISLLTAVPMTIAYRLS